MIGFENMGIHLARKLMQGNHDCVVLNYSPSAIKISGEENTDITFPVEKFIQQLTPPRVIWVTVPEISMDQLILELQPYLIADDIIINSSNSYYIDDIARSKKLAEKGVHYIDCCINGGELGLQQGYGILIGGSKEVVKELNDVFETLTSQVNHSPTTQNINLKPGDFTSSGYLHCGPCGAGHFIKMIHNGIEYALMAAYTVHLKAKHKKVDCQEQSFNEQIKFNSLTLQEIAYVWSRGSKYLDLVAVNLLKESYQEIFNSPIRTNTEMYSELAINQPVAEFIDSILDMIGFEFNRNSTTACDNKFRQQVTPFIFNNSCSAYQPAPVK